jgi:hypothetical protein
MSIPKLNLNIVFKGAPIPENSIAGMFSLSSLAGEEAKNKASSEVFVKYNPMLHASLAPESNSASENPTPSRRGKKKKEKIEIISIPFLKRFIHYAKTRIKPVLTQEACNYIVETYGKLRIEKDGREEKYRVSILHSIDFLYVFSKTYAVFDLIDCSYHGSYFGNTYPSSHCSCQVPFESICKQGTTKCFNLFFVWG